MLRDPVVMLHKVVLSLSDSLDLVSPAVADHQQRVAFAALRLADAVGVSGDRQADLMYAAALHDVGLLSVEDKINAMDCDVRDYAQHARRGSELLRGFSLFRRAADLVRWRHHPWNDEAGWKDVDDQTRLLVNMISLADRMDILIEKKSGVLGQIKRVTDALRASAGVDHAPQLIDCLLDLAQKESFWLDMYYSRIYTVLTDLIVWPRVTLTLDDLEGLGSVFSKVVDYRSRHTATHSVGVAAVAEAIAGALHFEKRECRLMRVAGYLHDLGKVAAPTEILDKPGKLDDDEASLMRGHSYHTFQILNSIGGFEDVRYWAALHHERLDGRGYPFHLNGDNLTLGSRIMAVADVFTAVTEDHPYRAGMSKERCSAILESMVGARALDGDVVGRLAENYDEINDRRVVDQIRHSSEYNHLISPA